MSKIIIFFGTDDFSAPSLRVLISEGYAVGAVVTKPDSKKGRGQHVSMPLVKQIALEHDIPVLQPTKIADIAGDLQAFDSPVGVLVSYGKIIPQSIIDIFTPGIINVHPSYLPLYRGSTPIEAAILHGDDQLGISVMLLTAAMDAGPVYGYSDFALDGTETQSDLYADVAAAGAETLKAILPSILDGTATPLDQNDSKATYTQLLTKSDAVLTPDTLTATQAERKVRAHNTYPKTKINVMGHDIIITRAHVSDTKKTPLDIQCQDGAFLSIDELVAPSGKTMSTDAFIRGYAA